MRIECLGGFFKFYEDEIGDISRFCDLYNLELDRDGDYFTFPELIDAPEYSILGAPYLGLVGLATYGGKPWDVMYQNEMVYSLKLGLVVPIASIVLPVLVYNCGSYFLTEGLIQPGSFSLDAKRVIGYSAQFSFRDNKFRYSLIEYE